MKYGYEIGIGVLSLIGLILIVFIILQLIPKPKCSINCLDCVSGKCNKCKTGFTGDKCEDKCSESCVSICDKVTGYCAMCKDQLYDPSQGCTGCKDSLYNPSQGCTGCKDPFYDSSKGCISCINPTEICSTFCLETYCKIYNVSFTGSGFQTLPVPVDFYISNFIYYKNHFLYDNDEGINGERFTLKDGILKTSKIGYYSNFIPPFTTLTYEGNLSWSYTDITSKKKLILNFSEY